MGILNALFIGAKALITGVATVGRQILKEVLQEIDRSQVGRVATQVLQGTYQHFFGQARDLAKEEAELADKAVRDGRRTEKDQERLVEIQAARERIRSQIEKYNSERAGREFSARASETLIAYLDDDEVSSQVGILSDKKCPDCGGTMRIRQRGIDVRTGNRGFYWQCIAPKSRPCRTIRLDPAKEDARLLRPPDPDLDTPRDARRAIWAQTTTVSETHARIRKHLGDDDERLICPTHLLPLKLLPKRLGGGRLLDSYEYVCPGVQPDGKACSHMVPLETMPQVASALLRSEGMGIIR